MKYVAGLTFLLTFTVAVSGQSTNLLQNSDGNSGFQFWKVFGNASVLDCAGAAKCFAISQDGFIFQDVTISNITAGTFAVFIGFASIEKSEPGDTSALGRPYLFGYFMTSVELRKATVLAHLSGQEMANRPRASGEWVKQAGVFKLPEGTGRIRIFLRSGCPNNSPSIACVSRFRQPGIFLFGTEDEARTFVTTYQ